MRSVGTSEELALAVRAWNRVFRSTDPFGWPFTSCFSSGRVLYPTDGCHLSREQFNSLSRAAAALGEAQCYVAAIEGCERLSEDEKQVVRVIDLSSYEDYARLHFTLENAVFSLRGNWGALVSHEMHALLAGDATFLAVFNETDKESESQWRAFKSQWAAQEHQSWLSEISSFVGPTPDS